MLILLSRCRSLLGLIVRRSLVFFGMLDLPFLGGYVLLVVRRSRCSSLEFSFRLLHLLYNFLDFFLDRLLYGSRLLELISLEC